MHSWTLTATSDLTLKNLYATLPIHGYLILSYEYLRMRWIEQHIPLQERLIEKDAWTKSGLQSAKVRTWLAFLPIPIQGMGLSVGSRGVMNVSGAYPLQPHHKSMLSSEQLITLLVRAWSDNSLPLLLDSLCNLQRCQLSLPRIPLCRDVMKDCVIQHQGKHSSAVCCSRQVCAQEQVEHVNQTCS